MTRRCAPLLTLSIFLYCLAVAASYLFCYTKLYALGYHTRDYPFYLQFAAKSLDPALSKLYSINPFGYNFLGLDGIEGMSGLYQTIHLEPIKFVYAAIYRVSGSPLPIFLLFGLLFFAPPLYLGWRLQMRDRLDGYFLIILTLLFILFPASLLVIADDLRPYTLLVAFFLLAFLSIHLKAPQWHTLLFFCLMLTCREEALLFALFLMGYKLLNTVDSALVKRNARQYGLIWLLWLGMTILYFRWTGYSINPLLNSFAALLKESSTLQLALLLALLLALIVSAYCLIVWVWLKIGEARRQWLAQNLWIKVAAFAIILYPLTEQVIGSRGRQYSEMEFADAFFSIFEDFMLRPKYVLIFIMFNALIVVLWTNISKSSVRRGICALLTILLACSLYLHSVTWMDTALIQFRAYQMNVSFSQLVWDLRGQTDQYETAIMTDLKSYQAFAEYEQIAVFERLPWEIEPSEQRHYPANIEHLVTILNERTEYFVIAKSEKSLGAIEALRERTNVAFTAVTENEHYQIFQIER